MGGALLVIVAITLAGMTGHSRKLVVSVNSIVIVLDLVVCLQWLVYEQMRRGACAKK